MARSKKSTFFHHKFPRYSEIRNYLFFLENQYPRHVRVESIGRTIQGRSIYMIVIQNDQSSPKDSVMIEAGIHAREWLANTTVLYIIEHVINNPCVLDYMDFYVIPCANPDGYEYTHKHDRLWRKNMNTNGHKQKKYWGVDLNRNFSYGYGSFLNLAPAGSSNNPESFMYRGPHCFSEPETSSLAYALREYGQYIRLYLAIHCYGKKIMYPWGFKWQTIPHEEHLQACANKAKDAMVRTDRKSNFQVGCMSKVLYVASGTSADYARGYHSIKFSYTIELHRGGKSGFTPRPSRILAVAEASTAGVLAMIKFVHRFYREKKKQHVTFNTKPEYKFF